MSPPVSVASPPDCGIGATPNASVFSMPNCIFASRYVPGLPMNMPTCPAANCLITSF